VAKKKKSLGRDAFDDANQQHTSGSVGKLIKGQAPKNTPDAKEVLVKIKLTPSNIKHLDDIRARLAGRGKGSYTRNDLIRIAITLLSEEDI
jgi:predicted AAA+ superfamily ATPase